MTEKLPLLVVNDAPSISKVIGHAFTNGFGIITGQTRACACNNPMNLDAALAEMELSYIQFKWKFTDTNVNQEQRLLYTNHSVPYNCKEVWQLL